MRQQTRLALLLTLALHAVVLALAFNHRQWLVDKPPTPEVSEKVVYMPILQSTIKPPPPKRIHKTVIKASAAPKLPATNPQTDSIAYLDAPAAPSAQEWAFAAQYTNKNSKAYRYYWGQQVRSMMGRAYEGADQGMVRFKIEIAPNGHLQKIETLWTTSAVAEKLARKAIKNLPPMPATPNGKPLVFERTIAFTPYATDGPPMYKNDCMPDLPAYQNPFAWDGKSPQVYVEVKRAEALDPQALADCLRQLPPDSIDAEMTNTKGKMDRWGWSDSPLGK
ncbi:MAG TPA: energy transducer TonB [Burkholderiaceae bacterium]|nr:energy transducer TonB [Burkholderiaceae bacterium]